MAENKPRVTARMEGGARDEILKRLSPSFLALLEFVEGQKLSAAPPTSYQTRKGGEKHWK